ncbi:non-hydrolyzing UDP-N-acetylglucosamine 2-epimerase [Natrinema salifodinae]|uniref:UDP-N-acetylglucosamine 2-epimerase (Non-hydrolysing) n=1 Tax=Natrinema salifodinae TaxID=1202768 RepID=A0A1I0LYU1_9EURY|nr:UDP-N-acetylglucosamine 2-epimerase (non-hydrolyzing) [Natrinema salifodinae]SEV81134.1 UDP-N-acetylglucosamine 2-epimerase (non-hydrolysing) [Natrinema salifodinae]
MADQPEIAIVLGTRPEIIKLAPIIRHCRERSIPHTVIHTGQHYSDSLNDVFFAELGLPEPEYELEVGSASHGKQTGEMIVEIEDVLLEAEPATVLVQGDTNSVLAGAIATSKLSIDLGHVESGLRSHDRTMPEERNRVLTDHASDYLFAPTDQSRRALREEGIPDERIHVTGNTVVDAVEQNRTLAAERSSVFDDYDISRGEFCLLTAHRAETVDDEDRFASLLRGAGRVADALAREIVYPIHPRAANAVDEFDLVIPDGVRTIEPQQYLDFLALESEATLVLTDSGGVQEEACILGVPCVTLRENTERPETLAVDANVLVGTEPDAIHEGAVEMIDRTPAWPNPFGDGEAAERIVDAILRDEDRMTVTG